MPPTVTPKPIFGAHMIGDTVLDAGFVFIDKDEDVLPFIDTFYRRGYTDIDTARGYGPNAPGGSEQRIGRALAPLPRMKVHTKILFGGHGGTAGDLTAAKIESSITSSLRDLAMNKVATMFLHAPDRQTPIVETVKTMDEAYKAGKFEQWGICNYTAAGVKDILTTCEKHGHVKPKVYQGQYNAVCRGGEKELFPLLREHGIAFWAFSPGAMGMFSAVDKSTGRRDPKYQGGQIHQMMYGKPALRDAATKVIGMASMHGISGHEAALRWVTYHSYLDGKHGDGVIFGVSRLAQLEPTLDWLEAGPLPTDLADAVSVVFETLAGDGPAYHL